MDERLANGERGGHGPALCSRRRPSRATGDRLAQGGSDRPGKLADLVNVGGGSVRLAGVERGDRAASLVFAATAADVNNVVVGGARRPRRRACRARRRGRARTVRTARGGWPVTSLVIDDIGLLVTNDPDLGGGPLGNVRDAALVFEDGRVVAVEPRGAQADERIDAGGRCVIPGFVDSHTHLVFAGDRAEEFAARMAGAPYAAGGIRSRPRRPARHDAELRALAARAVPRRSRPGSPTSRSSRATGSSRGGTATCEVAAELTDDVTFLGAHVCRRVRGPRRRLRRPRPRRDARRVRAARRWIDAFCETGAFDADQCRAVLEAGRDAGLGLRVHGNQLGPGPGVRLAVELGAASVDHCTYLDDDDVDASAGSTPSPPSCRRPTSRPASPTRTPAGSSTPAPPSRSPPTQSRLQQHDLDGLLHRPRVRDMGMTVDEALAAATLGGAAHSAAPTSAASRPAPAPTR